MSKRSLLLSVLPLAALTVVMPQAGCGDGEERDNEFSEADGGSSGSGQGASGGASSSGGSIVPPSTGDGGSQAGCSDAAKLVYVLTAEDELYSFNPAKLKFIKIGNLDCDPRNRDSTPNSMAVDRSGLAWVGYGDGELFKVDTSDASCESTDYDFEEQSFSRYGMGFSSNAAGSTEETLFLASNEGSRGLFKLDTGSLEATRIGGFGGGLGNAQAELTGTGDGKLFGFYALAPAVLAQIDKDSGETSGQVELDTIDFDSPSLAFAFSFWGGDFWFYSSTNEDPSKVTRLRTASDNSETVVIDEVEGGFRIVGAGVSTCAPTSPVN